MKKLLATIFIIALAGGVYAAPPSAPTPAKQSKTDTTNFGGNLSSTDTTVQAALDTIDDISLGGETTETMQDAVLPALDDNGTGTQTGIDVLYQDATNDVDFVVDVTPSSGSATLEISEDAVQVKYDSTDFQEGANGLSLGANPTVSGSLIVDNITINGNDISSTAGTDLTITPLAGQQIVLDGTIVIDEGVVTGATSITSTAFAGALTGNVTGNVSGTAATVTGAAQAAITSLGTLTTLTVDDITINGNTISSAGASTLAINPTTGQAITFDSTVTLDAGVVGGVTSLTMTGADASPSASGMLVYDNVVTGLDDGAMAYYGGGDTVYYLLASDVLPVTNEHVLAYNSTTDRLYWKADADSGGAPELQAIIAPTAAWGITLQDTETVTWTTETTATDQFNFVATGNFGDISIMKIEQNTGTPTNGDLLHLLTANANVDHLLLDYAGTDYVTMKIVDAGTFTIDVTSDGTAGVTFPDPVTFSVVPVLPADSIDAITEIAAALKSGSDVKLVTGTAGTDTHVAVWNADGDLVTGGGVPYIVGGTDVSDSDVADNITITAGSQIASGSPTFTAVTAPNFAAGVSATTAGTVTIYDAGTIVIGDDGDDTTVTIGPVGDGTTVLGVTGTISATGLQVGGANVYYVGGTDVADADVADNITITSISQVGGGVAGANAYDFGGVTSFEIPNGTSGTTDATGEIYLDTNGPDADYTGPVIQISTNDAVTLGYLFTIPDAPAEADDNKIIKYDAATNLFSLEIDDTGSALGGNLASTTNDITTDDDVIQLVGTAEDLDIEFGSNLVNITSDTGVALVDFGTINLATDALDLSAGTITNVAQVDAGAGAALAIGDGSDDVVSIDSTVWDITGVGAASFVDLTVAKAGAIIQLDGTDNWEIRVDETGNSLEIGSSLGGVGDNVELEIDTSGNVTATGNVIVGGDIIAGAGDALDIGDGSETITITSSDWAIDATGIMTGIGTISSGAITSTGTSTFGTAASPDAADGATLGSATAEWSDLYLADSAVIYGQADQSNTLTSSAVGWTFGLGVGIVDDKTLSFGGSIGTNDWAIAYDELTSNRLEFTHTAGNDSDVYWDLNDAAGDATFTIENSDATYEANLVVTGDISYAGQLIYTGSSDNYLQMTPITAWSPSGATVGSIAFEGASAPFDLKFWDGAAEYTVVHSGSSVTWAAATSHSYAAATQLVLPTAAADASGEISISTGEQLKWHDGTKVITIDTTPTNDNYVLKYDNASATFTLEADETGGTPAWNSVTAPTADVNLIHPINVETQFTYTGDFTTGTQFNIEQLTGNPSGGVLFAVKVADSNVIAAQIGDGTNLVRFSQLGAITFVGTGSGISPVPPSADGASLGTDALDFSDLFLASGGVINFDSGDITLTDGENVLTLAGGALDLTSGGITNIGSVSDDANISVTTTGDSDITLTAGDDVILDPGGDVVQVTGTTDTLTLTNAANVWTLDSSGDGITINASSGTTTIESVAFAGGAISSVDTINMSGTLSGSDAAFAIAARNQASDTFSIYAYDTDAGPAAVEMIKVTSSTTPTLALTAVGQITLQSSGTSVSVEGVIFASKAVTDITTLGLSHTAPAILLTDSDIAAGTGSLTFSASGANDIVASLQADIAGDPTTFIELDGVTETVDLLKPVVATSTISGTTITASTGFALGDTDYIGITGNEIITFNAAGSINVTGATMDVDGAFTATSVVTDAALTSGGAFTSPGIDDNADATAITIAVTTEEVTFSAGVTITGDITGIAGNDLMIGTVDTGGVKLSSDGDGALTILGSGAGSDESLIINLDDTADEITLSSGSGATTINASALNFVTTGIIAGAMGVMAPDADGHTITAAQAYGYLHQASGAATWVLPPVAIGMNLCVYSTGANIIEIDPDDADGIILAGAARDTDGDSISSTAAAGAFICLFGDSADGWTTLGSSGTWASN